MSLLRAITAIGLAVLIIVALALSAASVVPWIVFWIVAAACWGVAWWMKKTKK